MVIDYVTSTVEIGGRRFPAAVAVCPVHESRPDESECDRTLGDGSAPVMMYGEWRPAVDGVVIPAENGVLVHVEAQVPGRTLRAGQSPGNLATQLWARACYEANPLNEVDGPLWLPYSLHLVQACLVPDGGRGYRSPPGPWCWDDAEPDWLAEFIDRVSRLPFTQPPGPELTLRRVTQREDDAGIVPREPDLRGLQRVTDVGRFPQWMDQIEAMKAEREEGAA